MNSEVLRTESPAGTGPTGSGIRVLWVTPTISSSFGGPTTTVVNGLIAETGAGIQSSLVSTVSDGDEPRVAPALARLEANRIEVKMFPRLKWLKKGEAWGVSPRLALWMLRNLKSFEVVHLQYVWCMSSICGAVLARVYGIPLVITPHESLTDYDIDVASRSRIKRRFKLALKQLYLRTADRLVFMSELERQDTGSGTTPVCLISHAVQEQVVPAEPPEQSPTDHPLRIAFIGRNIPKKGIDLIVRAMGRNRERNWTLSIAGPPGTDDFIAEMRDLVEGLELTGQVSWLGFLDDRKKLFEGCDVLAMPSAYEGFGMVAAEALCCGVPVIVPRLSGVAEVVSEFDAGIVMPEASVDCLESALRIMDDDPARRRAFGERGLLAANSRLTYKAYASSTADLYASLLAG